MTAKPPAPLCLEASLQSLLSTLTASFAVVAVGIDIAEVKFFRQWTPATHQGFYTRVFADEELSRCRRDADAPTAFAECFAAKEAAVKALTGAREAGCPVPPAAILLVRTCARDAIQQGEHTAPLTVAALLAERGSNTIVVGGWQAIAGIALPIVTARCVQEDVVAAAVVAVIANPLSKSHERVDYKF